MGDVLRLGAGGARVRPGREPAQAVGRIPRWSGLRVDTASPFYGQAAEFLDERVKSPDILYLPWSTVMSYLRISTHPAIFANPLQPQEAAHNVETLLRLPHVRTHLATLLRQHGVMTLYTNDRDFRTFDLLNVRDPFA